MENINSSYLSVHANTRQVKLAPALYIVITAVVIYLYVVNKLTTITTQC